MKKPFQLTQRQWDMLNRRIDDLARQLREIEHLMPSKPKQWLRFDEVVPPESVCRDVVSMMEGSKTFTGFIGRLAEYYGCKPMGMFVDKTIDPKYLAVYSPLMNSAYSRENTVEMGTVLHEFFHHLVALNVVSINKSEEEQLAAKYTCVVLKRAGKA